MTDEQAYRDIKEADMRAEAEEIIKQQKQQPNPDVDIINEIRKQEAEEAGKYTVPQKTFHVYEIPRGSQIEVVLYNDKIVTLTFIKLDGAYSYCTVNGSDTITHFSANTELELGEDGIYRII